MTPSSKSDATANQVLLATWLGTFFDGMDASIFVIALFPTLSELLNTTSHAQVGLAASYILATFMVGWTVGSIVFGFIADKVGRVKTMIATILLYAFATGLCATSQDATQLGFFRFLVGCGIGGEITVSGVLLAECWSGVARYRATGIMLTAFGGGYMATAIISALLGGFGWRALYLAGVVPALLTIYIRLKLKDSAHFKSDMATSLAASTAVEIDRARITATGVRTTPQSPIASLFSKEYVYRVAIVMILASTSIVGYWAVLSWIPAWINQLVGTAASNERSTTAIVFNAGSIIGAVAIGYAFNALGHKKAFAFSFLGALICCTGMFLTVKSYGIALLCWAFMVGFTSTLPFVPLFIYVPELFPAHLRATAFGVSVQSGRLAAATAAILAGQIISSFGGSYSTAGACLSLVYIIGIAAALVLPKTAGEVSSPQQVSKPHPTTPVPILASSR